MNFKIEPVKLIGIAATAVGVAATILSNVSQQKNMEKTVAEEVKKALDSK